MMMRRTVTTSSCLNMMTGLEGWLQQSCATHVKVLVERVSIIVLMKHIHLM